MPLNPNESTFEAIIEDGLLAAGYIRGDPQAFDSEHALWPAELFAWLAAAEPQLWSALQTQHGPHLEKALLHDLTAALNDPHRGMLHVLRHGFKFYGKTIPVAQFAPAHSLSPEIARRYAQNRLAVTRQVHYSTAEPLKSIDMVLALNGLPIATLELKNPLTGQTVEHAKHQYKTARGPQELLFAFGRRALVHFAVDPDEVYMTTRIEGDGTYFLPFNRGNHGGRGNPPTPDGSHKTSYLWREALARQSILDILARFLHLADGKRMIFPRYHQLESVRALEAHAKEHGAGLSYLVQHSAGSGKSNSIAWLAHRLSSLHDAQDRKVFDSVVVVTDRRVLDKQLQDTVTGFEHAAGLIQKIDDNSRQLAKALQDGVPIIVTTLQKFPFITDELKRLPKRRYAVIVDEAHSSQSGESAQDLKSVLAAASLEEAVEKERQARNLAEYEAEELRSALARGRQPNLSYFAFTATPKHKTLEVFGHLGPDGKPAPFHLYSMRQAIEERFILDVLLNYTTYATYFRLIRTIPDDPDVEKRKAAAALARYTSLHPHNIEQKVEVIVEHFRTFTRHKIGGRAKAMLVTASRLHAVRFKEAMDKYIAAVGYTDMKTLVAFSGTVHTEEADYTETAMNGGISERQLPEKFASPEYSLLIVAEKYQTGFDQPLLHTMYVDKRLDGVQAVQTLSRLNRMCPGKSDTFVLDFINEAPDILNAFQPYYEQTSIAQTADPQQLYAIEAKLAAAGIYFKSEVDSLAKAYFSRVDKKTIHPQVYAYLNPAVDRFKERTEEEREEFKKLLIAFRNLYAFLAQILPYQDVELERLYVFVRLLLIKLPHRPGGPAYDFEDEVALQYYRVQKTFEGEIALQPGVGGTVSGPVAVGTAGKHDKTAKLSQIIDRLNERFGTSFTQADQLFFDQVEQAALENHGLQQAAAVNTIENFALQLRKELTGIVIDRMDKNEAIAERYLDEADPAFQETVFTLLLSSIYSKLREARPKEA